MSVTLIKTQTDTKLLLCVCKLYYYKWHLVFNHSHDEDVLDLQSRVDKWMDQIFFWQTIKDM